jgi:hypothetical protein
MRQALIESSEAGNLNAKQRRKLERAAAGKLKARAMPLDQFLQAGTNVSQTGALAVPNQNLPISHDQNEQQVERELQLALAQEQLRASSAGSVVTSRSEVQQMETVRAAKLNVESAEEMARVKEENKILRQQLDHLTETLTNMTQMLQAAEKAGVVQVLAENAKLQETISEYACEH